MSKEIEIAVKREETCIEKLCQIIRHCPKVDGLESLDDKTLRDLCDRIRYAAMVDADAIHRDANFAVNKLSETLERTTRMIQDKEAFIGELCCREPRRNCERFNSGDPTRDREDAWKAYLAVRDDGADDFERWLFESTAPITILPPNEEEK